MESAGEGKEDSKHTQYSCLKGLLMGSFPLPNRLWYIMLHGTPSTCMHSSKAVMHCLQAARYHRLMQEAGHFLQSARLVYEQKCMCTF